MPTGRLLIINPNTSPQVTQRLRTQVAAALPHEVEIHAATARFGAAYIASEASYAVAAHAALDAYAAHVAAHGAPDAVLLGCFGDPGVEALREISGRPVIGLAEAAMRAAQQQHGSYIIVTGGSAWAPMLARLARAWRLDDGLAGIHTLPDSGAALAADAASAVQKLQALARQALAQQHSARCVVLGGAGLAGLADAVGRGLAVPVLDSVATGATAIWPPHAASAARSTEPLELALWSGMAPHWQAVASGGAP